jgi:hypothetical protein
MSARYGQRPWHVGTSIFPVAWGYTQYPEGELAVSGFEPGSLSKSGESGPAQEFTVGLSRGRARI